MCIMREENDALRGCHLNDFSSSIAGDKIYEIIPFDGQYYHYCQGELTLMLTYKSHSVEISVDLAVEGQNLHGGTS